MGPAQDFQFHPKPKQSSALKSRDRAELSLEIPNSFKPKPSLDFYVVTELSQPSSNLFGLGQLGTLFTTQFLAEIYICICDLNVWCYLDRFGDL